MTDQTELRKKVDQGYNHSNCYQSHFPLGDQTPNVIYIMLVAGLVLLVTNEDFVTFATHHSLNNTLFEVKAVRS